VLAEKARLVRIVISRVPWLARVLMVAS